MSAPELQQVLARLAEISEGNVALKAKLESLEEKVDKHNGVVERMYIVEGKLGQLCQEHHEIQMDKKDKRVKWESIIPSVLSGVTVALLVAVLLK